MQFNKHLNQPDMDPLIKNEWFQAIVDALKCGVDVAECLLDTATEDLTRVVPYEWQETKQKELPQVIINKYLGSHGQDSFAVLALNWLLKICYGNQWQISSG